MFTYCQKLGDSTKTLRDAIGENIFLNIGLAKKLVQVFLYGIREKPERTFWPIQ